MNRPGIVTTDLVGQRGYNNGRRPGDLSDMDYTNDFGGTSAATPISAGIFGLMLSVNPELTRDEALDLVLRNADKVQPELAQYDPVTGFSSKYGYGRINAARAVSAAKALKKYSKAKAAPKAAAVRR
jgi:subtilisin family serine protease